MPTRIDELVDHPQRHFARPDDVLADPELDADDKRRILESWKLDALRLSESTDENMPGGEDEELRTVSKSLVQLQSLTPAPVAAQPPQATRSARSLLLRGLLLGAAIGAGLGIAIMTMTSPSIGLVAQMTLVGMILGAVAAALKAGARL